MLEDLKRVVDVLDKKKRQYASHYESLTKEEKELSVAEDFVTAISAESGLLLRDLKFQKPDPPDFVATDAHGKRVALEVTEIVCRETVKNRKAARNSFARVWRPGDLTAAAAEALLDKDGKTYHGGGRVFICLFTDEPMLTVEAARAELRDKQFGQFKQIDAAYLLFSYEPRTQNYPVIALQVRRLDR